MNAEKIWLAMERRVSIDFLCVRLCDLCVLLFKFFVALGKF